jgi:hypothetical protein
MEQTQRQSTPQEVYQAAWPDMFASLQTAYADLTRAQFELERRTAEIEAGRDLFLEVIESMSEAWFLMDRSGRRPAGVRSQAAGRQTVRRNLRQRGDPGQPVAAARPCPERAAASL